MQPTFKCMRLLLFPFSSLEYSKILIPNKRVWKKYPRPQYQLKLFKVLICNTTFFHRQGKSTHADFLDNRKKEHSFAFLSAVILNTPICFVQIVKSGVQTFKGSWEKQQGT